MPIRQDDLADHFSDATWHAETLCFNAHGVAKYVLSRAVRDAGYKVVLTGEGSDEIFGGYPHFRRDMLLYDNGGQDPADVQGLLAELERANPVSRGLLLPDGETVSTEGVRRRARLHAVVDRGGLGRPLQAARHAWRRSSSRQSFRRATAIGRCSTASTCRAGSPAARPCISRSTSGARRCCASYILVVLGDRMEMAHSVEGRVPFLDHHVVELVGSLPVSARRSAA